VLLALGWSLSALIVSAILLALLFQQAAIRRVDQTLGELNDNLVAGSTVEQIRSSRRASPTSGPCGLFRVATGRSPSRPPTASCGPSPAPLRSSIPC
jgi:hypothetical protein